MKILLLLIVVLLSSCEMPTGTTSIIYEEQVTEEINPIIGTWVRNDTAFTFYDNGDFNYYNYLTGYEYNYGLFIEFAGGVLYLEDPMNYVYVYYYYEIDGDVLYLWTDDYIDRAEWVRE